ncbi:lipopolysaccharide biosynthesis protein [Flavobacterium anhuiense]|uniref:lipopolysaccharide biosynthesis protein n=1 Tax=Flavobacterium anhuiense TaxID=459526 RepID=UPI003D98DB62
MAELSSGNRSRNINKQIILSFILKFFSMGLGFLVIPKTLSVLGTNQYGIWLTILSVVSWIVSFDVGIGNGLRNKLTEALAFNDYELSCKYISTGYFALASIGAIIIVVISVIIPFINWNEVFNTNQIGNAVLQKTMFVISIAVIINFIVSIVDQVMNAFQLPAFTNLTSILHSSFFILSLTFLKIDHDLFAITKIYSLCLLCSSLIVTFLFYNIKKEYLPRIKWIDISKAKDILKLGGAFFIIQIATIFMFSMSNMLIIQLLTAQDVSVYNVTFRLFSILTLGFSIIVTPFWSAFTEAYKKSDFIWIRKALYKLHVLLLITTIGALLLVVLHQFVLDLWLGKGKINPGFGVSSLIALYSIILNWSNIYSHFLNGVGQLKMQTIVAIIQGILVIPICLLCTDILKMGLIGIIVGMIACLLPFAILGPIATYKILKTYS